MSPPALHRHLDRWTIILTLLALGALLVPMGEDPSLQRLFNAAHVPGFAALTLLWAEDLLAKGWPRGRRLWIVGLCGLALAFGTEVLQALVPGRYADVGDMRRNALGIAIGLAVHAAWPGRIAARFQAS